MIYVGLAVVVFLLFTYEKYFLRALPYEQYMRYAREQDRERNLIRLEITGAALILMILLAGLREWHVGWDLQLFYTPAWLDMVAHHGTQFEWGREYLFNWLNQAGYFLFGDQGLVVVLTIIALIMVGCVYYAAKKGSADLALTMFLFITLTFYLRGYSEVRQCLATACCVVAGYAACHLNRKTIWLYLVMMFLAVSFHLPSIVFAPVILFGFVKNDGLQLAWFGILILAAVIFVTFEERIVYLACEVIKNKYYYNYYVRSALGKNSLHPYGVIQIVMSMVVAGAAYLYKWIYQLRTQRKVSARYNFYLNLWFCAMLFFGVAYISNRFQVYVRFATYFMWSIIFLIPEILATITHPRAHWIAKIVAMVGATVYLMVFLHYDMCVVADYQSVIQ